MIGLAISLAIYPLCTGADVIRLTNGNNLEGEIVASDERHITVEIPGLGALVLNKNEILSVEKASLEESGSSQGGISTSLKETHLVAFANSERSVRFWYPEGWHVIEKLHQHPYVVTILPVRPNPNAQYAEPVAIELVKHFHASRTLNLRVADDQKLLEEYTAGLFPSGGAIMRKEKRDLQGAPAMLMEVKAKGPERSTYRVWVLAAVKQDTLVALFCQAYVDRFETYQSIFEEIIRKAEPFSSNPLNSDNAIMDHANQARIDQVQLALQKGEGDKARQLFEQAIRDNPGDAATRMHYGAFLLSVAGQLSDMQKRGNLILRS
ncbi:MAG: hypothetical protein MN733_15885, partial [Nitrososphaera sp.]|nr:hypothetical protein [Nitrososphaera sp.]